MANVTKYEEIVRGVLLVAVMPFRETHTAVLNKDTDQEHFKEQNGALLSVHYEKISVVWTPKLFSLLRSCRRLRIGARKWISSLSPSACLEWLSSFGIVLAPLLVPAPAWSERLLGRLSSAASRSALLWTNSNCQYSWYSLSQMALGARLWLVKAKSLTLRSLTELKSLDRVSLGPFNQELSTLTDKQTEELLLIPINSFLGPEEVIGTYYNKYQVSSVFLSRVSTLTDKQTDELLLSPNSIVFFLRLRGTYYVTSIKSLVPFYQEYQH
ncbi:hypothetical protein J6590_035629 [Homalodisca vitripennis]|nr:hypothetical protein J6590_035629 [Homalodisca vitripennis]